LGIRCVDSVTFNQEAPNSVRSTTMPVGRAELELIYLPPLLPRTIEPVEKVFLKVKRIPRKIGPCGKETLIEAMGRALAAVSTEGARGFFAHCGYHAPVQQL
jgi:hypothetical protein